MTDEIYIHSEVDLDSGRTATRVPPPSLLDSGHPEVGYLFAPRPSFRDQLEETDLGVDELTLRRQARKIA